ncbi:ArnT family glycosyltransferase [Andreprevotia chitinilytica]|uniref:ArnT family glycosyltransferase n=1 Tax=Andreprevotia chitinilytica TaxID=396808 RepID=UPI00068F3009|nr:glycosyltransferase family 39 protein [Andreprevotia chitinilytica]
MNSPREIQKLQALLQQQSALQLGFGLLLVGALYYFLPGLIGHDPWKQDETYTFSMILHLLQDGDWVVMRVAGEPFMEKPPLYYWSAALMARLFGGWLPLHDAARLTSGLYMVGAFAAVATAVRHAWGRHAAPVSCLALAACPALMLHGHGMITDVAQFFGATLAICGLMRLHEPAVRGSVMLGVGLLAAFLSKGLLIPGVLGVTGVLLPVLSSQWRTRAYATQWARALLIAIPLGLIWPTMLYLRAPDLFTEWFWLNNIGRFLGFAVPVLGAGTEPGYFFKSIPGFAFPVLPLALWSLWLWRKRWHAPQILVPALFALVLFGTLSSSASARALYALPILSPLAMLAYPALIEHSGRADRVVRYISLALFGGLAAFVIGVWGQGLVTGHMPTWAWLARMLPSDFKPELQPVAGVVAAVAIGFWIYVAKVSRDRLVGGLMCWTTGLMLLWTLAMTLWLPWLNEAKSYRQVMEGVRTSLAAEQGCITSVGLGESERAMLHYFGNRLTDRVELGHKQQCNYLLIEDSASTPTLLPAGNWLPIWRGNRAGDNDERFRLFESGETGTASLMHPLSPKG